jgi:uncharacterized protein with PQ loop repeat
MEVNLPILAGSISTMIFALSTLPMLVKAFRTKDLRSYSLGNILLSNMGNIIHSIYIFNMPPGPIWLLHTFYLVTTAMMLVWYVRYETPRESESQSSHGGRVSRKEIHSSLQPQAKSYEY